MDPRREPPGEPGQRSDRLSLKTAIAVLVGLGMIGIVVGYLAFSDRESDQPSVGDGAQEGVACPHLRDAYDRRLEGKETAVRGAVEAAARAGEAALDRSGQVFGRPEEIALQLEYAITEGNRAATNVSRLLENARDACIRLGQW
jgi:hypothetical protein